MLVRFGCFVIVLRFACLMLFGYEFVVVDGADFNSVDLISFLILFIVAVLIAC